MKRISGQSASKGLAVGRAVTITRQYSGLDRHILSPVRERASFEAARAVAQAQLEEKACLASGEEKDLMCFQAAILDDISLLKEIYDYIAVGAGAAAAVERAAKIFIKRMEEIDNEYFKARAVDIKDACFKIVDMLDGRSAAPDLSQPCILVSQDIYPSDLVGADKGNILGIITSEGSQQSHVAILSRMLGIPAIVNVTQDISTVKNGDIIAVNGDEGEAFIAPDEETSRWFSSAIAAKKRRAAAMQRLKDKPCVTRDGVKISLLANCNDIKDIEYAVSQGADGIGLLRSEMLLLEQDRMPGFSEQCEFYKKCLEAADGRPVTIRTFDVGADKAVTCFGVRKTEENPALGLRGVRVCLENTEPFITQLCALLYAGRFGDLKVMFPMISGPQELIKANECVKEAKKRLREKGIRYNTKMKWGCMLETPAAAVCADILAKNADFFSIGTNDLTQYTHAADRGNKYTEKYYEEFSPALRRIIAIAVEHAKKTGTPISVCGEIAANPAYAAELCKMGITQLSMAAASINEVKEKLMGIQVLPAKKQAYTIIKK